MPKRRQPIPESGYRTLGPKLQRVQALVALPSLQGKVALVTGGTDGVGRAVAHKLATSGATVVLTARDVTKGERVRHEIRRASGNDDVHVVKMDLASLASVRAGAANFLARWERLDLVVCNAGILGSAKRTTTIDGFESTIAVNHLAHALLLDLLEERFVASAPSTVVIVASEAHRRAGGGLDLDDLMLERCQYRRTLAYGRSKQANIMHAVELGRRLGTQKVRVVAAHPGGVDTPMMRSNFTNAATMVAYRVLRRLLFISPEQAAEGILRVALDPALANDQAPYFEIGRRDTPKDYAIDPVATRRLFDVTQALTRG